MRIIADLHIHSKYSQATSKNLDIPNLEKYARIKGINLLGTGDFTHPKWIEEIRQHLTEEKTGFLKTASGFNFVLSTEVSLIYSQGGKGRRIHNLVLAPDLEAVNRITEYLLTKGRVDYDGRPIFKIPCPEFVRSLKAINECIEIIPAHIWTPWFSLFGSKSGFDSLNECFQD
ncbi:MAG: endonuclease Q family protein, partial [Candidatus Woesearchaeota archaeon]